MNYVRGQQAVTLDHFTEQDILAMLDETGQLSWERTLAFRQFRFSKRIYVVLLNDDGEFIAVRKTSRKLLAEFSKRYHISDVVLRTIAQIGEIHTAYSCTHGKFKLISTRGGTCADTTWIMAHHINSYGVCPTDQLLTIAFNSKVKIKSDISKETLDSRIADARWMSNYQSGIHRQIDLEYGFCNEDSRDAFYGDQDFHLQNGSGDKLYFGIELITNVCQTLHKDEYGSFVDRKRLHAMVAKVLEKGYMGSGKLPG